MSRTNRSPLHDRHLALGAKLSDFAGFEMPVSYPGGGVIAEHTAVRTAAGIFDVSHLGKVAVRGRGAAAYLNTLLSNDLGRIGPGRAQYTLCCDEASGGVVDDVIVYLRDSDDVLLLPNAANTAEVARRLAAAAPAGVEVENLHTAYAVIAVQGPRCVDLLGAVGLPVGHPYMSFTDAGWRGAPVTVCRTGYTGEHGYELLSRWTDAGGLWDTLLEAGDAFGARPAGLGARDTLRTEMGYPLHGQDLSPEVTPVQARLGWAVGWKKPAFWGRGVLLAERERGAHRLLWGLAAPDRTIPRPGMTVRSIGGSGGGSGGGTVVGRVTSGTFSPTRRTGIGLALLDRSVAEGDEVHLDVRGRTAAVRVVRPPFVRTSTT